MHVIEHHSGKWIHVPIHPEGMIGCQAGACICQAVEHVDVREAVSDFPGAQAGLNISVASSHAEEIFIGPDAIEDAQFPVVRPVFAGEEVADIGVGAEKVVVARKAFDGGAEDFGLDG